MCAVNYERLSGYCAHWYTTDWKGNQIIYKRFMSAIYYLNMFGALRHFCVNIFFVCLLFHFQSDLWEYYRYVHVCIFTLAESRCRMRSRIGNHMAFWLSEFICQSCNLPCYSKREDCKLFTGLWRSDISICSHHEHGEAKTLSVSRLNAIGPYVSKYVHTQLPSSSNSIC